MTFDEWWQTQPAARLLSDAHKEFARKAWNAAREDSAMLCEVPMSSVLLQVGEMPRQSIRDGKAILSGRAAAIRQAG